MLEMALGLRKKLDIKSIIEQAVAASVGAKLDADTKLNIFERDLIEDVVNTDVAMVLGSPFNLEQFALQYVQSVATDEAVKHFHPKPSWKSTGRKALSKTTPFQRSAHITSNSANDPSWQNPAREAVNNSTSVKAHSAKVAKQLRLKQRKLQLARDRAAVQKLLKENEQTYIRNHGYSGSAYGQALRHAMTTTSKPSDRSWHGTARKALNSSYVPGSNSDPYDFVPPTFVPGENDVQTTLPKPTVWEDIKSIFDYVAPPLMAEFGAGGAVDDTILAAKFAVKEVKVVARLLEHGVFGRASGRVIRESVSSELKHGEELYPGAEGPELFENQFPEHEAFGATNTLPKEMLKNVNGRFNYVVTKNNELVVGKYGLVPGRGHIDLAGGTPVQAAGEVRVSNGQIKYIDNSSGHYLPSGVNAQQAAENAFKQLGFDIVDKYIEKLWVEDSALPRGGAWRSQP